MQKLENHFWRNKLKPGLPLEFLRRIENKVEPGWPDTFYMHHGYNGFIELKATQKFPNKINFEPAQPIWLNRYWNLGGTCYIMLYVAEENKIYMWSGKFATQLGKSGGTHLIEPLVVCRCNKQGWMELYELFSSNVI